MSADLASQLNTLSHRLRLGSAPSNNEEEGDHDGTLTEVYGELAQILNGHLSMRNDSQLSSYSGPQGAMQLQQATPLSGPHLFSRPMMWPHFRGREQGLESGFAYQQLQDESEQRLNEVAVSSSANANGQRNQMELLEPEDRVPGLPENHHGNSYGISNFNEEGVVERNRGSWLATLFQFKMMSTTVTIFSLSLNFVFLISLFSLRPRSGIDHSTGRYESILHCASQLSGLPTLDTQSAQRQAALYFLDQGHEVEIPAKCSWDSDFGEIYSLIVLRESINLKDEMWFTGHPLDRCSWPRIHCSNTGRISRIVFNNANITGKIPREISGLVHLKDIQFYSNKGLYGRLPSELGQLQELTSLQVHQTSLNHEVPPALGSLLLLEKLMMDHTAISGVMPEEVCSLRKVNLHTLTAACGGNQPLISCPCCTYCNN